MQYARTCTSPSPHRRQLPTVPTDNHGAGVVRLRGAGVDTYRREHAGREHKEQPAQGLACQPEALDEELRAAVKWLQTYRDERMQAHGRPIPILPEQRRHLVSELSTPAYRIRPRQRLATHGPPRDC